ncbi:MAG: threonine-phosphate decarboxylase [Halanaeroarchaeum sp.]
MDPEELTAVGRVAHGGSPDHSLDFSANTNPEVPSGTERVYREAFGAARDYPAEPPTAFREAAAEYVGTTPEQVVPTPGGLAAIRLTVEALVDRGDSVLVPAPSFGEYEREVRLQGATPARVDEAEILDADPAGHALAVLCTPNNPTGRGYDRTALLAFVERARAAKTPVLVDEAFLGFTDRESLAGERGVVVARSLTKLFGLPGLRTGFAVATGDLRTRLLTGRRTWNLATPALRVGTHVMGQTAFVEATRERVATERERMRTALTDRFEVAPSVAPFLLLAVEDEPVAAVRRRTEDAGIAIRDARTFHGLDSHVRVAIRRPAENDRLLGALLDA